jgi:peptide/nickel transport system permease protein
MPLVSENIKHLEISFWRSALKSKAAKASAWFIGILLFFSIFGDFIANDKPIYAKVKGTTYYPIFNSYAHQYGLSKIKHPDLGSDWHDLTFEKSLWPIIPFSGNTLDLQNAYKQPFAGSKKNDRFRHLLGTGALGKDVAAGIVEGTRIALVVGLLAIFFAAIIGLLVGAFAGYFGDHYFRLSWIKILGLTLGLIMSIYYAHLSFQIWSTEDQSIFTQGFLFFGSIIIGLVAAAVIFCISHLLERFFKIKSSIAVPMDILLMRVIEIVNSIPALLILLVVAGMFEQRSIWIVIFIIAFIKWTGIAKFVRAELLRIRSLDFIQSARASGLSEWNILWRHAVPNAMTPVLITIAFGIASAILLEATISFLGIGIDQEVMSWGKMLAQARDKSSAWWLAIFPGIMIFACVMAFNIIGDRIRQLARLNE